jgi:hypothetical protein
MNPGHSSMRSFLGRGRPEVAPEPDDPADMGTCFGLEMTLAAAEADRPGEAPDAADALAGPWWQRRDRRGPLPA